MKELRGQHRPRKALTFNNWPVWAANGEEPGQEEEEEEAARPDWSSWPPRAPSWTSRIRACPWCCHRGIGCATSSSVITPSTTTANGEWPDSVWFAPLVPTSIYSYTRVALPCVWGFVLNVYLHFENVLMIVYIWISYGWMFIWVDPIAMGVDKDIGWQVYFDFWCKSYN